MALIVTRNEDAARIAKDLNHVVNAQKVALRNINVYVEENIRDMGNNNEPSRSLGPLYSHYAELDARAKALRSLAKQTLSITEYDLAISTLPYDFTVEVVG